MNNKAKSSLLFIALTFIWGTAFLLIKKGLEVYTPLQGASIRVLTAAIVLLPVALVKIKTVKTQQEWFFIAVSGVVGSYVPAALFATAQTTVSSSTAGVLSSLTPVFTAIISIIFFKNKLGFHQYLGLGIGLAGAVTLASLNDGGVRFNNYNWLLIVGATLCYASNLNFLKFKLSKVSPITIAALSVLIISPVAFYNLLSTDFIERTEEATSLLPLLYLGVLGVTATAIALVLFNSLLKIASPQFASSTTYAIPLIAILWGVFDGESFTFYHFVAVVVILFGLFLLKKS